MTEKTYDLFVIGAGSGGARAARIASRHGANVGLAEMAEFGGTCVNAGCVPKKLMVYASEFSRAFKDSKNYGWIVGETKFDWNTLIANKDKDIKRINNILETNMGKTSVDIFKSHARFIDNHTIEVSGQTIKADKILIATGGKPALPSIPGKEHLKTSDNMFHLPAMPSRIVIIGGGYIAVEFANIFSGLGADVTLLHRGDLLLRGFDNDLREMLGNEIIKHPNIDLRLETEIQNVEKEGETYIVHTNKGEQIKCDLILSATGRAPNIDGLGLENTNIQTEENGRIKINDDYQTDEPHIYAVGDVCNRHNLTPVAIKEGHALSDRLIGSMLDRKVDYEFIATAVFSHPPIGTVGLSEQQARDAGHDIDIYKSNFKPMKNTVSGRDERALTKLVVDKKTDRVLGFHMIGDSAPEIIQLAATLLKKKITKEELDETIAVHPTAAEEFVTMREAVS